MGGSLELPSAHASTALVDVARLQLRLGRLPLYASAHVHISDYKVSLIS
jgi:hypothetical protein